MFPLDLGMPKKDFAGVANVIDMLACNVSSYGQRTLNGGRSGDLLLLLVPLVLLLLG